MCANDGRKISYALGVIVCVLLFDLRSIRYTILSLLPLGVGLLQTFGILGLLDIPLNPANMIALPILLGISVDEGVHVVHDFLDYQHSKKAAQDRRAEARERMQKRRNGSLE